METTAELPGVGVGGEGWQRLIFRASWRKLCSPFLWLDPPPFPCVGAEPCLLLSAKCQDPPHQGLADPARALVTLVLGAFLSTPSALPSQPESFQEQVGGPSQSPQDLYG